MYDVIPGDGHDITLKLCDNHIGATGHGGCYGCHGCFGHYLRHGRHGRHGRCGQTVGLWKRYILLTDTWLLIV